MDIIVLNLHSTMYLLKLRGLGHYSGADTFTFHYVSIKTVYERWSKEHFLITFHYVSIKTPWS